MLQVRLEKPVVEKVTFTFDPFNSDNTPIKAVFEDELARTIWIAIKRNHIVDQHFNKRCLIIAKMIRKHPHITGKQLNHCLCWDYNVIGCKEETVGDEILPFILGDKIFEIEYKIEKQDAVS